MFDMLPILYPEAYQALAHLLEAAQHPPPAATLYAGAFVAHMLRLHRIAPWFYLGLALAALWSH